MLSPPAASGHISSQFPDSPGETGWEKRERSEERAQSGLSLCHSCPGCCGFSPSLIHDPRTPRSAHDPGIDLSLVITPGPPRCFALPHTESRDRATGQSGLRQTLILAALIFSCLKNEDNNNVHLKRLLGDSFSYTLPAPNAWEDTHRRNGPLPAHLYFLSDRDAYKGTRPALGTGNFSSKSPRNRQRNP